MKIRDSLRSSPTNGEIQSWRELLELPALKSLVENLQQLCEPNPGEKPVSRARGKTLWFNTAGLPVSRLEEFASCPFRFFIRSGLRADERKVFEPRRPPNAAAFNMTFSKKFHEQNQSARENIGRDLTARRKARERIHAIADGLTEKFTATGLLRDTRRNRVFNRAGHWRNRCRILSRSSWRGCADKNEFDPVAAGNWILGTKESPQNRLGN